MERLSGAVSQALDNTIAQLEVQTELGSEQQVDPRSHCCGSGHEKAPISDGHHHGAAAVDLLGIRTRGPRRPWLAFLDFFTGRPTVLAFF
jgi:hypothetical protein